MGNFEKNSFTINGYITNLRFDQLPVGLRAQLVAHCTSIAEVEVMGGSCLRVRSLRENLRPRPCRIDRTMARSILQGRGLRFSGNHRTFEVDTLFIIWLFAWLLQACNRSVGINGGNVAEWLGRRTWNPEITGSSPALTT